MNYQKIILVGNAVSDAEIRKSKDGKVTFTTFRLAVADVKHHVAFFPVVLFGRSLEKLTSLITKGRQILVEGRIQIEKDRIDLVADRIELGALPKRRTVVKPLEKDEELKQSSPTTQEKT